MEEINKLVRKHTQNYKELKTIYMGDDKMNYEKSKKLQEQQKREYKKAQFFINLRNELLKNNDK